MADISKITLPSGTTYNIKDQGARDLIDEMSGYTDFLGVTTTALTDGATTNPITINGESVTAKKGNIVTYGSAEFIFNGTAWQLFGDLSGLGDLAFKDSASGTVAVPKTYTTTVTPSTVTKYVAGSATGGGSVTAGTKASCTLPVLTTSVANETLTIGWSAGSFTQNTPTVVTLPSFSSQTIATGISSASTTTATTENKTVTVT